MNFKQRVKMYLGKEINEMSMPVYTETQAAAKIMEIAPLVNAGKTADSKGDYRGHLEACLTAIKNSVSPEKYAREVKVAIAAMNKLKTYAATKATNATPNLNV
jgi:hypothetical protein